MAQTGSNSRVLSSAKRALPPRDGSDGWSRAPLSLRVCCCCSAGRVASLSAWVPPVALAVGSPALARRCLVLGESRGSGLWVAGVGRDSGCCSASFAPRPPLPRRTRLARTAQRRRPSCAATRAGNHEARPRNEQPEKNLFVRPLNRAASCWLTRIRVLGAATNCAAARGTCLREKRRRRLPHLVPTKRACPCAARPPGGWFGGQRQNP